MLKELEKKSAVSGPIVWLVGGLHGDEPGGGAVIKKLFEELGTTKLLRGSLHAFPFINESGAANGMRELPETGEDLNRLFPGQPGGTRGEEIVHNIWQAIIKTKPTLVLDLHNDWINSVPYILIEDDRSAPAALAAGLIVVRENPETLPILEKTLSGSLTEIGIPALTIELGGAYVVDEKNVRIGVNAVSRILCQLGLLNEEIYYGVNSQTKVFDYSNEPKPTTTGKIKMFVRPGQMIRQGDLIAEIAGDEKLFSLKDGVILGYTDKVASRPGEEIVALGVEN